jgi:hydrogenase small subunit
MPGFPDKFSPFYKAPPGSAVSGNISRTYGSAIRRLRRMSMRADNFEPIWDKTGQVPSPFAAERRKPTTTAKVAGFFYKRLQYSGSVDHDKRWKEQPLPRSMDILAKEEEADVLQEPPD